MGSPYRFLLLPGAAGRDVQLSRGLKGGDTMVKCIRSNKKAHVLSNDAGYESSISQSFWGIVLPIIYNFSRSRS